MTRYRVACDECGLSHVHENAIDAELEQKKHRRNTAHQCFIVEEVPRH